MIQPVNIINIYKLMLVHESTVICAIVHLP